MILVIFKYFLLVAAVLSAVLLVCVILLQRSKDHGLGLAFGANVGESLFGARTTDVLTKATIILGAIFFVSTMILARIFSATHRFRPAVEAADTRGRGPSAPARQAEAPGPVADLPLSQVPLPGESEPAQPAAQPSQGTEEGSGPADAGALPPAEPQAEAGATAE